MAGSSSLNYGQLMQRAMRGMMSEVLSLVAQDGLPGDHHFYISFETQHPGVDIPDRLVESYPEEMTIVLQEWFADLAVTNDRFSVVLNFSDTPETLVIPFAAVRTFVDPSVKFGLKFDAQDSDGGASISEFEQTAGADATEETDDEPEDPDPGGADVVSLDKFRRS